MNSFGRIFRISVFGESHGPALGVVVDGIPPGIKLDLADFTADISRRSGGLKGTTPRVEEDLPEILSGWFNESTTGSPITILFRNKDIKSSDYDEVLKLPRPGHADFVAAMRYKGYQDHRGGGHFSGRLTLALIAAAVIAKKIIDPVRISARILEAGGNQNIELAVSTAMEKGDSIGSLVECCASQLPVGWGEPFFDSVESVISHLAFAIPAIKGIEFGSGFLAATMKGSEHNDPILDESGKTATNHAGGITGGLTNGNELVFRVAVKPSSSISISQKSFSPSSGEMETLKIKGRHDTCIGLRVPVILEAITAIALADFKLLHKALAD